MINFLDLTGVKEVAARIEQVVMAKVVNLLVGYVKKTDTELQLNGYKIYFDRATQQVFIDYV